MTTANSAELLAFKREMEERDAHMRATSFVCRHYIAYFMVGFGLIATFMAIFGYFMVNGNAGSHPELLDLSFLFVFTGVALVAFTFMKISGWSTLKSILLTLAFFVITLGLTPISFWMSRNLF